MSLSHRGCSMAMHNATCTHSLKAKRMLKHRIAPQNMRELLKSLRCDEDSWALDMC